MSQSLVSRSTGASLRVPEIVDRLSGSYIDLIRQRLMVARETYLAPPRVSSPEEFRGRIGDFFVHYERSYHGVEKRLSASQEEAFAFFRQHCRTELMVAERNSLLGRDGGFIHVIDQLVESLIKSETDAYVARILWEYLPHDHADRLRIAQELLSSHGRFLCPTDELLPAYVVASNLEDVLKDLSEKLRLVSRELRW